MKLNEDSFIEFTPSGYTMSMYDRGLLAGAIMDENVEVICTEVWPSKKQIKITLKNVWVSIDWKSEHKKP